MLPALHEDVHRERRLAIAGNLLVGDAAPAPKRLTRLFHTAHRAGFLGQPGGVPEEKESSVRRAAVPASS